ncbi:hypothetical protein CYMTET_3622 [Cymbomonas tetramitiformis]|uniref:Uncharacterized protein n=1 Tax=Cymbomonas tetramitiformis TaxID=36881 RepID=A0AAE0H2U3_9CHLO|nr:hypothetical protein CYMTET_3622 [Cymbomonas tetramitiformis]
MEDDAIPKTPAGPSISASHFAASTPAGTFQSNPNSTGSTPAFALTSGSQALPGLGAPAFASPWSQPVTPHSAIMNSLGSFATPNTPTPLPMTPLAPLSTVPAGRALPSPVGPPPDLAIPVARAPSPSPHANPVVRTMPAVMDTPEPKRQRIDPAPFVKPIPTTSERVDEMNLIANRLFDLIKPTIGPHFIFPVGGEQTLVRPPP